MAKKKAERALNGETVAFEAPEPEKLTAVLGSIEVPEGYGYVGITVADSEREALIAEIDAHLSVVAMGNVVSPSETQRLLRAAVSRLR